MLLFVCLFCCVCCFGFVCFLFGFFFSVLIYTLLDRYYRITCLHPLKVETRLSVQYSSVFRSEERRSIKLCRSMP